ncbi:MAG: hypothetical protein ACREDI_10815 [Roseiarcus sp.]
MSKHEPSMPPETVSVLHTAVPRPSRLHERRLHKRHISSRLKLIFLGAEYEPISWSLGGFLVADSHPHTAIGTIAAGFLNVQGQPGRFAIRVELVRRDKRTREIAFRFLDPSRALLDALTRIAE